MRERNTRLATNPNPASSMPKEVEVEKARVVIGAEGQQKN